MNDNKELSDKVYGVESGVVSKGDNIIDNNYIVLDTINTDKETIGKETSPKKNSMQAMTVGKIKDEYKNWDNDELKEIKGYPETVITKDIKIVYAGTNPKDWQDWKTNASEIKFKKRAEDGAFNSAFKYADYIENKYKGFSVEATGHSMGASIAVHVSIRRGYQNAIVYSAADYALTEDELKNYSGKIFNIYDTSDGVTSGWLTGGKHKLPFYSFGIDNYSGLGKGWVKNSGGHSLDLFKVDKDGHYIDKHGDIAIYSDFNGGVAIEPTLLAQQIIANKKRLRELEGVVSKNRAYHNEINQLKKENSLLKREINMLMAINGLEVMRRIFLSNGRLTANEQIYLDDSQALIIVQRAQIEFNVMTEKVVKIYQDGIKEAEDLWTTILNKAQGQGSLLDDGEVETCLQNVGFTREIIVNGPCEIYQEKIKKVHDMGTKFMDLATNITEQINLLVQKDSELAKTLSQTR